MLGRRFRARRELQKKTLTETAARAGISPQYLSEVERGLKDPSSEIIAAIAGALGVSLTALTAQVANEMLGQQRLDLTGSTRPTAFPRGSSGLADQSAASGGVILSLAA
jgi:transcriptional regulator with XRE-family HTH domain